MVHLHMVHMAHLHFMLYWQVKQRIERSTQTKTLFQTSRYDVMVYQRIRDQAKHLFFFFLKVLVIIHLVRTQNFLKNWHFLHVHGKKKRFSASFADLLNEWTLKLIKTLIQYLDNFIQLLNNTSVIVDASLIHHLSA